MWIWSSTSSNLQVVIINSLASQSSSSGLACTYYDSRACWCTFLMLPQVSFLCSWFFPILPAIVSLVLLLSLDDELMFSERRQCIISEDHSCSSKKSRLKTDKSCQLELASPATDFCNRFIWQPNFHLFSFMPANDVFAKLLGACCPSPAFFS